MKLWLVQMAPKLGDKEANIAKIVHYITQAAEAQVNLIAFPEMALTGYMLRQKFFEIAEPIPGPATREIADKARTYKIYVTFGMPELSNYFVYNSAPLFGPDGLVGVCRKLHLVTCITPAATFEEDMFFRRGNEIATLDTDFGKLGIQICYDFNYPEVARTQALQGALLLLNLSAAPIPRPGSVSIPLGYLSIPEKFQLLARARAIESQAYFGYVNRVGVEDGVIFGGGSCISTNMGYIEKSASIGMDAREEVVESEIDTEALLKARLALPYLKNVRAEILLRAAEVARLVG